MKFQSNRFRNIIDFASDITKEKLLKIGKENLIYNLKKWVQKDIFDIISDVNKNVTLVQLMNTLVNVNHAISIVGCCIFDSNYAKALHLKR